MMKKAFLFLADGFEESEAIAVVDILRRGEIDCQMVSIYDRKDVRGAHGVEMKADMLLSEVHFDAAAAYILPGGLPGANYLNECTELKQLLAMAHEAQSLLAAICAAPQVLGEMGILKDRRATCYPSFEPKMVGANPTGEGIEMDGHIITGKGPAFATAFALQILSTMDGQTKANEVASGFLLK